MFLIGQKIAYHALRALYNFRSNLFASAMSIITLTLCLLLLGVFFILLWSTQRLLPEWMMDTKVVVYLKPTISSQDQEGLARKIREWSEVQNVQIVSKEEAWERLRNQLNEWKEILEGIQENPLPPSLEIAFKSQKESSADLEALLNKVREFPEVEEVYYGKIWIEKLESFVRVIKFLGSGLIGLVSLVTVLIVSNTIKLTVFARQDELEIYRIVGATPTFTKFPFYIEGIVQGIISTIFGTLLLTFLVFLSKKALPLPLAATLSWKGSEAFTFIIGLLGCGVILGWLGSWLALRRFLRV